MVEKISVQIALDGGDEVAKQLAAIGDAASKAFANVKAGDAAGEIQKVGEASETTSGQLAKVNESGNQAAQSFNQVAQESLKTATAVASLTGTIAQHGVEIALAVQRHQGWIGSLISMASSAGTAARAVGLLSPQFALLGTGIGSAVGAIALAVTGFEVLEKAATKFAADMEKTNNTLQTLAATSGKSFEELQRGEAAFGQIGISAETFRSTVGKINETLAGTEVTNLTKGMKDIVEVVKEVAAGEKGITFAGWVKAEDKVKGVAIAMKQAADAGKNSTQVLLEFLRNADLASSIKVGAAFGLSEADVDRVRRLGENITDLTQRLQSAPPLISPEAAAGFDRMRTSIQNVDSAWARLKQSLSSTVFSGLAASFSTTMNSMEAAAVNGIAKIVELMNQAGRAMATPPPQFTAALTAVGQQLQNAVTGLNGVVANIVGAVMQQAGASAAQIQAVKNEINGVTQAAQASGQAAQQSGVMFTQWGTVAQQGANTAKAGVQEATLMFTQFGTVAQMAGGQGAQAGQQAAAGFTAAGNAAQSGSDKVADFASKLAGIAWDTISTGATTAFNAVVGAVQPALTAVTDFASKILTIAWDSISSAGIAAWNAITGAIQGAINKVLEFLKLKSSGGAPATGDGAPGKARGGFIGGRGTGTSDSNLAWLSRGEYIMPARAVGQPGVLAFLEALRRGGNLPGFAGGGLIPGYAKGGSSVTITGELVEALDGPVRKLFGVLGTLNRAMTALIRGMDALLASHTDTMSQVFDDIGEVMVALGDFSQRLNRNARGGLLGGRGTGTSDSNLAWVSRGEHIMPARAVRQPGVLEFLELLRRSGGNLSRVLDGMGRFALGGMVPRAIPAFAGGGMVGGGNHVTIQFPGLPAIGGLRASSSVVDQLQKAAALAQVRSGGRKPLRYS